MSVVTNLTPAETKSQIKKKKHHHDFFFKYLTFNGVYEMLLSRNYKYSSPLIFNDPFDLQFNLIRNYETTDEMRPIYEHAVAHVLRGVESEQMKYNGLYHTVCKTLLENKNKILEIGSEDLILKKLLESGSSNVLKALEPLNANLREIIDSIFIFCVSTNENHPLMWSHYSDGHQGAVLKLRCIDEESTLNYLSEADEVSYSHDIPMLKVSDFLSKNPQTAKQFSRYLNTKGDCWSYEKEWRHAMRKDDHKGSKFIYQKFDSKEIAAIYLGCKMPDERRTMLINYLKNHMPHVEIYSTEKNEHTFSLKTKRLF